MQFTTSIKNQLNRNTFMGDILGKDTADMEVYGFDQDFHKNPVDGNGRVCEKCHQYVMRETIELVLFRIKGTRYKHAIFKYICHTCLHQYLL